MRQLIAIVGPTGTGKTNLAIELTEAFQGEIVNADSQQVFRYMDIGTAKPIKQELNHVPHHLIDIINPDELLSVAQFQELAYSAIDDIHNRGKLPFLVGGSGQYIWSVLEGWQVPRIPPDPEFRRQLEEKAAAGKSEELYRELENIDPAAAQKIDRRNIRRVIRALEVSHSSSVPFSQLQKKKAPPYNILIVGLTAPRAELYRKVDERVEYMINKGLIGEVENLLKMDYTLELPALRSIGYKQIGKYINGELTLDEAKEQMKFETHRLIRQQYTWLRLDDQRIHWFDIMNKEVNVSITELIEVFLKNSGGDTPAMVKERS